MPPSSSPPQLSQAGKLADTGLPTIQNSVNVADFSWDPFNSHRLVVAGDDAKIRVWQVPEGGLTETLTEPEAILQGKTHSTGAWSPIKFN